MAAEQGRHLPDPALPAAKRSGKAMSKHQISRSRVSSISRLGPGLPPLVMAPPGRTSATTPTRDAALVASRRRSNHTGAKDPFGQANSAINSYVLPDHRRRVYKPPSARWFSSSIDSSSDQYSQSSELGNNGDLSCDDRGAPPCVVFRGRLRPEVQRPLQLRRLHVRHRQPLRQRASRRPHPHPAPLRRDLLRPRHLPLLRRAPRRRLPRREAWATAAAAVEAGRRRLPARREHGHHRRHRHGVQLLHFAGRGRQDLEQRAPGHPDPVVPEPPPLRLRLQLRLVPVQLPVRAGRAGRERLQRADLRRVHAGAGGGAEPDHRERHRRRRREAAEPGRQVHRGAWGAPRGVLPDLPDAVPDLQRRRLRPVRLPEAVQRALVPPQLAAPEQGVQPAEQVPRRQDHVRRLLRPRLRHGQEPRKLRVQHEPEGVLRRRRGQVQLPERREVRHVGRVGVRQPGVVAELGRDPPHGGGLQEDRRRMAQRGILPPGHSVLGARCCSVGNCFPKAGGGDHFRLFLAEKEEEVLSRISSIILLALVY